MEAIEIELNGAVGPRVLYVDGTTELEIEAELPSGWTVDFSSQVRTDGGRWSCPLVAERTYTVTGGKVESSTCVDREGAKDVELVAEWSDGDRWNVGVTLVPDRINGRMVAYGDAPDTWIDGATIARMRKLGRDAQVAMCHDLEAAAIEVL